MGIVGRPIFWAGAACILVAGCAAAGAPRPSAASAAASAAPAATPGPSGCAATPGDVPTFRGGASRSGRMPGPLPADAPAVAWNVALGAPLHSSPAVIDKTVFQGTARGSLWAIDLLSGVERWRTELEGALTSPTVVGDLVVVGSTAGHITAVERSSGTVRWVVHVAGKVLGAPARVDDGLVVGSSTGDVTRLDARDGRRQWTTDVGGEIGRSIAVGDGLVVVPVQSGEIVALDPADGSPRWSAEVAARGAVGTPAIEMGVVLAGTGLDSGEAADLGVVALHLTTGAFAWRWASPDGEIVYTPAVVDGRAYAVSEGGFVQALAVEDGRELWRTAVAGPIEANPAATESGVVVADDARTLTAVDGITGETRWSAAIEGTPYAAVATCGLVLIPSSLGSLTAFGPP